MFGNFSFTLEYYFDFIAEILIQTSSFHFALANYVNWDMPLVNYPNPTFQEQEEKKNINGML